MGGLKEAKARASWKNMEKMGIWTRKIQKIREQ